MDDIRFENSRFDPDSIAFHGIAKQMAKSVGYATDLSVGGQLAQLLRLQVTQMNACSHCSILHTKAAYDQGITGEKAAQRPSWRESTVFSAPEMAAHAYCEGLTASDLPGFVALHDVIACHFDEVTIAEVAAIVINMNLWTRLKLAQGTTSVVAA